MGIAQFAVLWLLRRPEVTTVLVGASGVKQLDADLAAARLELEHDLAADLDDVSAVTPIYPRWWDEAMGLA